MAVGGRKGTPISTPRYLGLTQGNPFGNILGSTTSPTAAQILASVGRTYRSVPQTHKPIPTAQHGPTGALIRAAWTRHRVPMASANLASLCFSKFPALLCFSQLSTSSWKQIWGCCGFGPPSQGTSAHHILSSHPACSHSPSAGHQGSVLHGDGGDPRIRPPHLQSLLSSDTKQEALPMKSPIV